MTPAQYEEKKAALASKLAKIQQELIDLENAWRVRNLMLGCTHEFGRLTHNTISCRHCGLVCADKGGSLFGLKGI